MGIFTSHLCEELQTWSSSSEVSFLGIPRESQDLCSLLSYCLCGEDKGLPKSTQLLVSFISPHKAVSSQSVSRRLSRALRMAGIELNYTGHSTMGASNSALPRKHCLPILSWKQRAGLLCRPLNSSITESHLLVPLQGQCLTIRLLYCRIPLCYTVYRRFCTVVEH